jgi:hypothetical protein
MEPEERFLRKIDKTGPVHPVLGTICWNFTGRDGIKYRYFCIKFEKFLAHRWSYEHFIGPIGDKHVLHKCDNTICVRPDHLFLGTNSDNMQDMLRKGRHRVIPSDGEANGNSRLNDIAIKVIKYFVNVKGYTRKRVARAFGINASTIGRVVSGLTWASS